MPQKGTTATPFDLTPLFPSLSPEDTLCAQEALWGLLKQQARLYAPDSTSLPAETAAALAESILLTLGADRNPAVLLSADLHAAFRQGQRRLSQKLTLSQHLLQAALASRPQAENRSLSDTLNSLKSFSKRWDLRFFAQEIPCDIDYQLSQPVSETLRGVTGREEACRRLTALLPELEKTAREVIAANGYAYGVRVELAETSFPTKTYDGFALPAGEYLALRVLIGEAAGQNWWCVVFPPLCTAAASDVPTVALDAGLTDQEVALITEADEGYVLKFKAVEL